MKIKLKINLHLKLNYLELLTPFSTENKITKDKNGKNASHLEIAEVILLTLIINKMCIVHLFQINRLVPFWKYHQQLISF